MRFAKRPHRLFASKLVFSYGCLAIGCLTELDSCPGKREVCVCITDMQSYFNHPGCPLQLEMNLTIAVSRRLDFVAIVFFNGLR